VLPLPDEPEVPPDDALVAAIVMKGLVNPLKSGCVIAVGLMPKAAPGI
jgi:hypothetical protein